MDKEEIVNERMVTSFPVCMSAIISELEAAGKYAAVHTYSCTLRSFTEFSGDTSGLLPVCELFTPGRLKAYENGERILETFERSAPGDYDMILMDVQMPVMNGYEATKAIRKSSHEQAKTIPIIAMTANAFSDDIHHSLTVGMNAHISKPVEMKVLEKTISSIKFGGVEAQITEQ